MGFGFPLDLIVYLFILVALLFLATNYFIRIMKFSKKKTNGDRIRSMTDYELASFLISADSDACAHCRFYDAENNADFEGCRLGEPCGREIAAASLQNWLSSETTECKTK